MVTANCDTFNLAVYDCANRLEGLGLQQKKRGPSRIALPKRLLEVGKCLREVTQIARQWRYPNLGEGSFYRYTNKTYGQDINITSGKQETR